MKKQIPIEIKKFILSIVMCLFLQVTYAQDVFIFSGYVQDAKTNDPLDYVSVSIKELNQSTYADDNGFFRFNLPKGNYSVVFELLNYEKLTYKLNLEANFNRTFSLHSSLEELQQLDEVQISATKDKNFASPQIGVVELEVKEIKKLPAFMGEVDIIKTAQSLPGISSVSEGSQGFYVRGGGPDQNLVLLDGAQIYNASHLFGFFSVFNVDAISSMELMKGGMTADYGGKISSLMKIRMNEGDLNKYHVNGGIGIIASRLEVDGPIQKGKSSFMVAGRRTYIDVLMKPFLKKDAAARGLGYYFYDLNFKLNFRLTEKDRLYLSSYIGEDRFKFSSGDGEMSMKMPWGNKMASIRYNRVINPKHIMDLTGFYTQYDTKMTAGVDMFNVALGTGILDFGGKLNFTYLPITSHRIRYGVDYVFHRFIPSSVSAVQDSVTFNTGSQQKLFAHETAFYIADDWDITEKLRLNFGLRYSMYQFVGPFDRMVNDIPSVQDSIIHYPKGKMIAFHNGWEPRLSTRYLIGKSSSIKAGISMNTQYVHMGSLSAVSFPTDMWVPTTEKIKPQSGWQATVGYFKNFLDGMLETSVEVYYKGMNNLIEFKNGSIATDNINDNPDNQMVQGKGRSYGIEFFIKKTRGNFTGWIGYTLAKSERIFPQIQASPFPAKYDRTHDLNVVLSYKINDNWTVAANFVYATGNTMTMPSSWYIYDQNVIMEYGSRNSTRMPDYHRLDLSATWSQDRFKSKMIDGKIAVVPRKFINSVNISIYNVYNRSNPYLLYLSTSGSIASEEFALKVKQVSLFPILPSVTWNFEF